MRLIRVRGRGPTSPNPAKGVNFGAFHLRLHVPRCKYPIANHARRQP